MSRRVSCWEKVFGCCRCCRQCGARSSFPSQIRIQHPRFRRFAPGIPRVSITRRSDHSNLQNRYLPTGFAPLANCDEPTPHTTSNAELDIETLHHPISSDHVPQYLKDIISRCLAKEPNERPAACELLKLLPAALEGSESLSGTRWEDKASVIDFSDHENIRYEESGFTTDNLQYSSRQTKLPAKHIPKVLIDLEKCCEAYPSRVICDGCGRETGDHYFQCNFCSGSDVQFCPWCTSQGLHCMDSHHYLQEVSEGKALQKYYASMRESGGRDTM